MEAPISPPSLKYKVGADSETSNEKIATDTNRYLFSIFPRVSNQILNPPMLTMIIRATKQRIDSTGNRKRHKEHTRKQNIKEKKTFLGRKEKGRKSNLKTPPFR